LQWFLRFSVSPRDCAGLSRNKNMKDGVYTVTACETFQPMEVYCDFSTFGGVWTAIQRRWRNDFALLTPGD